MPQICEGLTLLVSGSCYFDPFYLCQLLFETNECWVLRSSELIIIKGVKVTVGVELVNITTV